MELFLFAIYALLTCGGALGVVFSQNIVRMAFYLVISLGSIAGLFFLLGADFVGATQLLIYVGGTVVLLIFGVMLTSNSPFKPLESSPAEMLQSGFLGLALIGLLTATVLNVNWPRVNESLSVTGTAGLPAGYDSKAPPETTRHLGMALLGLRPDRDLDPTAPTQSAFAEASPSPVTGSNLDPTRPASPRLSSGYLLIFELISMHLLVVLIGAAYLARAKKSAKNPESTIA